MLFMHFYAITFNCSRVVEFSYTSPILGFLSTKEFVNCYSMFENNLMNIKILIDHYSIFYN